MAIAYGNQTNSANTGSSSLTFAAPTITGSDTILWVAAYLYRFTAVAAPTYNGVPMTQAIAPLAVQANRFLGLWYVVSPVSAANVVVSGTGVDGARGIRAGAIYYTGVSQTGVPDAAVSELANPGTTVTDTLTTVADNAWTIGVAAGPANSAKVASTGVTTRGSSGTADGFNFGDSNGPKTPPGGYSMTFTTGVSDSFGLVMASFAPAGVITTVPDLRLAFI